MKVVALIETNQPIAVERFAEYPQLGRFTVREEGRTVGIGKITKLIPRTGDGAAAAPIAAQGTSQVPDVSAMSLGA